MPSLDIQEAALSGGRGAEFIEPDWRRVAPCHWKAMLQVGVDDEPFTLRVKLIEGGYSWDVSQPGSSLSSGVARSSSKGRALARRAAQDLTTTLRPAPVRRRSLDTAARQASSSFMGSSMLDRAILPYFGLMLLTVNLGFSYYGLIRGTSSMTEVLTAVMLLAGGGLLHMTWVNMGR